MDIRPVLSSSQVWLLAADRPTVGGRHCGLWQSSTARAPPDVESLILELDAADSGNSIDSPDQADPSQELTYVDIDTFLASF